jgi:hypothetical protein
MKINAIKALMLSISDLLTGSPTEMSRRLKSAFGDKDFTREIHAEKQKNRRYWMIALMLMLCLIAAILHETVQNDGLLEKISRPLFADQTQSLKANVKVRHGSDIAIREVQLLIQPEALIEQEKEAYLKQTADKLPKMVLGENEGLDNIVTDLYLPSHDAETLVTLTWYSDKPDVIDENGLLNPVTALVGDEVTLEARLALYDLTDTVTLYLTLGEPATDNKAQNGLDKVLSKTVRKINESRDGFELILPANDNYGVTYQWHSGRNNYYPLMLVVLMILCILIHKNKYHSLNKRIKRARESLIRDFPEFINKLLILLNAGMIVQSAIIKIADDYVCCGGEKRELYEELVLIKRKVEGTNASFVACLNAFAARSTVREIMRFAAIITDNIHKGAPLADKLNNEGDLVWSVRKKKAEEAGRVAETKMILPMSLILIVLVIITVTPAVLTM